MNSGRTVFSQLIDHLPIHEFRKCVARYRGNHRARTFSCWDQFLCLAFAQLTYRESLRDIVACLNALKERLYHMGIRGRIARTTFSDANDRRDWRIYADFAQVLIREARSLYANDAFGVALDGTVYALDATIIDLSMTLFPWARFKSMQNAVKLHTLLDLRGNIPTFLCITPAKIHDVNFLDQLVPEAGAFYVMDRGYLDSARLYRWTQAGAFFITRARKNLACRRLSSKPVDKSTGVRCDQTVEFKSFYPRRAYPAHLRRVAYADADQAKRLVFLTNNFALDAKTIADLYRTRWQIELFFKWIKQHLRIKAFYGTSENAVKTQIWSAVSVYLLVAIARKRLAVQANLYTILQVLSVTLLEKTPLFEAFSTAESQLSETQNHKQLWLFDL
ncbi:MAG: IS4 family transposase [Phycisphaerales bacterium]|nr:IS4 family transposase [Phycisphaerales bacterium]